MPSIHRNLLRVLRRVQTHGVTTGGLSASLLATLLFTQGCGNGLLPGVTSSVQVSPATSSVLIAQTVKFQATQSGQPANGGTWQIVSTGASGSIAPDGTYTAPASPPSPNTVKVDYVLNGTHYSSSVAVVNPSPAITSALPSVLQPSTSQVMLTGNGFVASSSVAVNGNPVAATFVDSQHLLVPVSYPAVSGASEQIAVTNLDPVAAPTSTIVLQSQAVAFSVSPATLTGGPVTLAISGANFTPSSSVNLDGNALTTTYVSPTQVTATGYLAPWKTGTVDVQINTASSGGQTADISIPIAATAVSYDAAARFTTQAAFGPRHDVVEHIQAVGFDQFITEQMATPSLNIPIPTIERTYWLRSAISGNILLRQRVAQGLQTFLVTEGADIHTPYTFFEHTMENDAFGNVRQLLSDLASDASIGAFLGLTGNVSPSNPTVHPNQNFARELMQLFTLGLYALNDDGTVQLDENGQPIASYGEDTVLDMARVFTGWENGPEINPLYYYFGMDFSSPLVAVDSEHDHGSKTLFGTVNIPAGQTAEQDRTAALDAIFQHPNLPPFFSKLLIQRLVTSNPSPAYVGRISAVFKDDGTHTRGNLAAVIRAILLDPEARRGDTTAGTNDGFLQEPQLFQTFAGSVLENYGTDGQMEYYSGMLGEDMWTSPTVFYYFSPSYVIPGTTIVSPEFQIFNNQSLIHRSELLWGMINGSDAYSPNDSAWIYSQFNTIPDLVDALNHQLYHGTMSSAEQQEIISYCTPLASTNLLYAKRVAVFLALNADSYTVSN